MSLKLIGGRPTFRSARRVRLRGPARHGAHGTAMVSPEVVFLAELLRQDGWQTAGFSANVNASPVFDMDQGFEYFFFPGTDKPKEYEDLHVLFDQARAWLDGRGDEAAPFLLYMQLMNVHGPYMAPPEYREQFLDGPHETFEFQGPLWNELRKQGRFATPDSYTPAHQRDLNARYDGALRYTDESLGAFFDELDERGVFEDALVIVTADHGEELYDRGGFGHGISLYPELTHVPLMIRLPGGARGGQRESTRVDLVDLVATILDLTQLLPEESEGRYGDGLSLQPLLTGSGSLHPRAFYSDVRHGRSGVASALEVDGWQVIETVKDFRGRKDVLELFDVEADPERRNDLAVENADRARVLRARKRTLRRVLEQAGTLARPADLDPALRARLEALGYSIK